MSVGTFCCKWPLPKIRYILLFNEKWLGLENELPFHFSDVKTWSVTQEEGLL